MANVESQKSSRLTNYKIICISFLWRATRSSAVILKSHYFTSPLSALCTLTLSSLTAGDTACCDGTGLAECGLIRCCLRKQNPRTKCTPVLGVCHCQCIRAAAVGARLVSTGETMADQEDNVTIPGYSRLLQMDPNLKTYEKDFERR